MTKHVGMWVLIGLLAAISCSSARAQATGRRVLDHQVSGAGGSRLSSQWATRLSGPVRAAPTQSSVGQSSVAQSSVAQSGVAQSSVAQSSVGQSSVARPSPVQWSPVRPAQHHEPLAIVEPAAVGPLTAIETGFGLPSHRVLQAPREIPSSESARSHHAPKAHYPHPPRLGLGRRIAPPPAMLPNANRSETWKTPYSYGYFGASGKRQWSLSHGYRDRYTQWELR